MAYDLKPVNITLPAAASFTSNLGYVVDINNSGQAAVQTTANGRVAGVIASDVPAAGLGAAITVQGVALVVAGGAIAAGDTVGNDTSGRAVTYTHGSSSGVAFGRALQAATAAGQLIPVLLLLQP